MRFWSLLVAAVCVLGACRGGVIPDTEIPTTLPIPVATPIVKLEYKRDAELEKQFAEIAKAAGGKVGVAAVVLETGEAAFLNEDGRNPMQSVYKLPIAMAVMEQVRLGNLDLDEKVGVTKEDFVRAGMRSPLRDANPNGGEFTIRELIRLSLVESDGTASDVLMRLVPALEIQTFLSQIGVRDMKVANTEKEIGRDWKTQYENWSTPVASVELLRWLAATVRTGSDSDGVPAIDTKLTEGFPVIYQMAAVSNPGAKRLKGLLPSGTVVAHKTGTGGTQNGITGATNDIGIISLPNGKTLAIAVFVSDSPADEKTREATIAKIAKAAWDKWSSETAKTELPKVSLATCWTEIKAEDLPICEATIGRKVLRSANLKYEYRAPIELTYAERDLNGDSKEEFIVWESSWSGTSGGSLWILERRNAGLRKIFETEMTWTPILKLDSKKNGWHSNAYLQAGGGVESKFIRVGMEKGKFTTVGQKPVELVEEGDMPKGEILIGKAWEQSVFGPMTSK